MFKNKLLKGFLFSSTYHTALLVYRKKTHSIVFIKARCGIRYIFSMCVPQRNKYSELLLFLIKHNITSVLFQTQEKVKVTLSRWDKKRHLSFHTLGQTKTKNICKTFVQRQPNVFDAGPTLYKCYTNVLCLCQPNVFDAGPTLYKCYTNVLCLFGIHLWALHNTLQNSDHLDKML